MKKRIIIIVSVIVLVILISLGVIFGLKTYKENNKIYSVITIDVNPSMKLNLNRNNKVLSIEALNKDADIIVDKDVKGKDLNKALSVVVDKLQEKEYLKDNTILINVDSENKELESIVEKDIKNIVEEKKIETKVVVQSIEVTEEIKNIANTYNISESKAAYISEQIKDEDIKIEEIVEKSIDEIKEQIEEKKEEIRKEEEKQKEEQSKKEAEEKQQQSTTKPSTQNSQQTTKPSTTGGCNPPAKATENISDWCNFNKKKSQNCNFSYPEQLSLSEYSSRALKQLGVSQWDTIGNYASIKWGDSRSSYCFSGIAIITTREKRTTFTFDSVTGELIDTKSEAVKAPTITEEQAVQILLDKYGLKKEDLKGSNAHFSVDGDGSDNYYYRYDTSITMNDGTQHLANINPYTGAIIRSIY